jgi:uncharacterized protein YndB with AHSA1/START domain
MVSGDAAMVCDAWTDPEKLKLWSAPEGMGVDAAQVDLTVGGRYRNRMQNPDGGYLTAVGVYREIDRPN